MRSPVDCMNLVCSLAAFGLLRRPLGGGHGGGVSILGFIPMVGPAVAAPEAGCMYFKRATA